MLPASRAAKSQGSGMLLHMYGRWKRAAKQLAAHPGLSVTGLCLAAAGLTLVMDRFTFVHFYILSTGYRCRD